MSALRIRRRARTGKSNVVKCCGDHNGVRPTAGFEVFIVGFPAADLCGECAVLWRESWDREAGR